MVGAHRNVTITRGRSGKYKNRLRPQSAVLATSTPKRRVVLHNPNGSFTVESINLTLPSTVEDVATSTPKGPKGATTMTRMGGGASGDIDVGEGTLGLDRLNMSSEDSLSDMDISFD
ncbi:hypothetical protein NLI96_g11992 [Meripilus lineatus]|uniref:Uncharacterized protein n=1 Tax=Meripilus lineatus TaxID=2056292 RepID=A0AAD5UT78_9APHY|nr:hypothetical protein NLI96_g11992 [Physisporinus lineatus]